MVYKSNLKNIVFLFSIVFVGLSCRIDKNKSEILLSGINKAFVLDSISAGKAIVKDDIEKFFEKIAPVDMMIQMHRAYPIGSSRDSMVLDYQNFLKTDVLDFTKEETEFVTKALFEAFALCNKVSPKIFPAELKLIKTHGKHYGDETYYTRENLIIIPKDALKKRDYDVFLQVLLHEISHVVTRLNPSVKAQLYATIGFKKLKNTLSISDSLKQRLLLNPDGMDLNWTTQLTAADGKNIFAIPLIYANETTFLKEKPDFFQYLGWNYYEIAASKNGENFDVLTIGNQQKSTLKTQGISEIFKQKYNTDYIIHPDEIVADNFSFLMLTQKNPANLSAYTEGGKILIKTMTEVIAKQ